VLEPVRRRAHRAASRDTTPLVGANLLIGLEELFFAVHALELNEGIRTLRIVSALLDGHFNLLHQFDGHIFLFMRLFLIILLIVALELSVW